MKPRIVSPTALVTPTIGSSAALVMPTTVGVARPKLLLRVPTLLATAEEPMTLLLSSVLVMLRTVG